MNIYRSRLGPHVVEAAKTATLWGRGPPAPEGTLWRAVKECCCVEILQVGTESEGADPAGRCDSAEPAEGSPDVRLCRSPCQTLQLHG